MLRFSEHAFMRALTRHFVDAFEIELSPRRHAIRHNKHVDFVRESRMFQSARFFGRRPVIVMMLLDRGSDA